MIDKILFDLGNVLLRFDFHRAHREMASHGARVADLEGPLMTDLKIEYETGLISTDEMFRRTSDLTGYDGPRDHFERSWQDIFSENTPMIAILADLRGRDLPCYLLSNSNELHVRHIRESYGLLSSFDQAIFSYEVGVMKPCAAIYEKAIAQFDLNPAKTAYIDDRAENIATGRRFGFRCLHYCPDAHDLAETELAAMGLVPS